MKNFENTCDSSLVDRFWDKELEPDEQDRVREHIKKCAACQKTLQGRQRVSGLFHAGLKAALSQTDLEGLEETILDLAQQRRTPWWMGLRALLISKRVLIPAAAMALILMVFFSVRKPPESLPATSAGVISFAGESESDMIMYAPKTNMTIIWYKESS